MSVRTASPMRPTNAVPAAPHMLPGGPPCHQASTTASPSLPRRFPCQLRAADHRLSLLHRRYKGEVTTLRNLSGLRHVDAHTVSLSPDGTEVVISLARSLTLDAQYMVRRQHGAAMRWQKKAKAEIVDVVAGRRRGPHLPSPLPYPGRPVLGEVAKKKDAFSSWGWVLGACT